MTRVTTTTPLAPGMMLKGIYSRTRIRVERIEGSGQERMALVTVLDSQFPGPYSLAWPEDCSKGRLNDLRAWEVEK